MEFEIEIESKSVTQSNAKDPSFGVKMELEKELTKKFLCGEMSFADYSNEWYYNDDEDGENVEIDKEYEYEEGHQSTTSKDKHQQRRRRFTHLPPALLGLMGEANLRFARGDKETAEQMCHEIIKQVPTASEPYQTLAQIYESDADKTLQFSLLAAHLSRSDANEWLRLATICSQRQEIRQEMSCYNQAIKADPQNLSIHLKRLELLTEIEEQGNIPIHTLSITRVKCYHKIVSCMKATDGDTIMKYARLAAKIYHSNNEIERMLQVFGIAYKKCSSLFTLEDVNIFLEALISLKQFETCLEIFVAVLGVVIEAEINTIKNSNGVVEEQTTYTKCQIPNDLPIDLKTKLLVCFIHLGATNLVKMLLDDFLSHDVEKAGDLYMDIEEALSSVGHHELAMQVLEPLVKNTSFDLGAVWLKHADCLYNLGREDDSIHSYYKVLKHAPQHPDARCKLYSLLEKKGCIDEALDILQQDYKYVVSAALFYEHCCALKRHGRLLKYLENTTLFALLRLLLPKLERERPAYNLKEKSLGSLLVRVLALSKKSPDAKQLLHFRSVSNSQESDFAGVVYFILKYKVGTDAEELTIGQINEALDKIATHAENRSDILDQTFSYILRKLTAEQLKWFLRIILKDMRLGVSDNHILSCFHPDAPEIYKMTNSLSKVCKELEEDESRPTELGLQLNYAVTPMLSERLDVTDVPQYLSPDKTYHIEKKFDGERFQMHMKDGVFKYFSKKGHSESFTKTYGETYKEGLLTPFLKDSFGSDVKNFVIDGEMMGWHKELQSFGSKSMPYNIKKITENSKVRPCFCAFDILYYNDKSLVGPPEHGGLPLDERLPLLDNLFKDIRGVIQHSARRAVHKSSDVLDALNEAMQNDEEGIVVKDTKSYYISSQRKAGWYKIKPEYTEGVLADLDLVIIGADEAADKTHGRANSFVVACAELSSTGRPQRWLSVSHVSNGLTHEERAGLCAELELHWKRTADHPPPEHLVFNECKPDFWIEPDHSAVLQIHATELVRTSKFGTPYTLQFPRVERLRHDKPVNDAMTIDEFKKLIKNHSPVIKLAVNAISEDQLNKTPAKSPRKRQKKVLQVAEQFRTGIQDKVEVISNALAGRRICILSDEEDCSRTELIKIVESHGGQVVANYDESCWCCVSGRCTSAVRACVRARRVDVLRASWLRALRPAPVPLPPPHPLHALALSPATRLHHAARYDIHADSYTEPADKTTLIMCFEKMDKMPQIHLMPDEMLELDRTLFGGHTPLSFLRPCVIHFVALNDLNVLLAKMYGASVCDANDTSLTHIIVPECIASETLNEMKKKHVDTISFVGMRWLEECFSQAKIINETDYLF
ncbi:DNA ligase 4-like isoform X2 [Bombyx mandarina]|uniref:DNA ligase 4 n=1 Tax=Bombyx mandarina TaxID=7092 RepID=A0A6J2JY22_BOMMA|nr:DNA ligase 4-like isoform X2 [Bombyx mandarina]